MSESQGRKQQKVELRQLNTSCKEEATEGEGKNSETPFSKCSVLFCYDTALSAEHNSVGLYLPALVMVSLTGAVLAPAEGRGRGWQMQRHVYSKHICFTVPQCNLSPGPCAQLADTWGHRRPRFPSPKPAQALPHHLSAVLGPDTGITFPETHTGREVAPLANQDYFYFL